MQGPAKIHTPGTQRYEIIKSMGEPWAKKLTDGSYVQPISSSFLRLPQLEESHKLSMARFVLVTRISLQYQNHFIHCGAKHRISEREHDAGTILHMRSA